MGTRCGEGIRSDNNLISTARHGGYAEMTCVLATNVIKFEADNPDWGQLGALPEMLQTALGSLDVGCDGKAGQSILIRGGTSSVGMCAAVLAKQRRMTVLSTTRNARKSDSLKKIGVDHVIIDDGAVSEKVRDIQPDGVDCAIELVGATALRDTLRAIKVKGTACFTGMLNDDWTIKDMYPMGSLLCAPSDLGTDVILQNLYRRASV